MKRKIFLTIAFIISLVPMVASQYGGMRGMREISGLTNLWNPIGIISVVLFLAGIWIPFKQNIINKFLSIFGLIGIIAAEIVTFLFWPVPEYISQVNLQYSLENAYPEFYLGLATSALMLVIYLCTVSAPNCAVLDAKTTQKGTKKSSAKRTTRR